MKFNKWTIPTIVGLLLVSLIISSCGASKSAMNQGYDSAPGSADGGSVGMDYDQSYRDEMGDIKEVYSSVSGSIEPKKVITSVYLSLETTEFDSTIENLGTIIGTNKGYVENSNISRRNRKDNTIFKSAEYTIRVPKDNVDSFTDEISSIGNILSENTSREDITKQYYDTESRLNLLKIKEERMTAILGKAQKIEDIITIENQLSEIIHQKESMTKDILDMDDKVSYSIIYINISEVEKLTAGVSTGTTFATKISNAFSNSLYAFKAFVEGFALVFIYVLPYLLIGGLLAFLIFKFIRRRHE